MGPKGPFYFRKNNNMATKILVVEDQEDINSLITLNLSVLGHEVISYTNGLEAFQYIQKEAVDLIVLDLMLPGMDGLSFCKQLREANNYTPVLMLTAKKTETDRVMGLEVGADDYLTKPFSVLELQARVKALLRRIAFITSRVAEENDESDVIVFSDLKIDTQKREVHLREEAMSLTAKEFDLLFYLATYPGRVFSRDQLLDAVWGYKHSGYEHTVNSHINRLRSKLEEDPSNPKYVLTVWGVGYKFSNA